MIIWWYFDLVHTERIHSRLAKWPTQLHSLNIGLSTSRSCTAKAPIWWLWGPPWRLPMRYAPPKWHQVPRIKVTQSHAKLCTWLPWLCWITTHTAFVLHVFSYLFIPFLSHAFQIPCLSRELNFNETEMDRCLQCWEDGHVDALLDVRNLLLLMSTCNWLILIELQNVHSHKDPQCSASCWTGSVSKSIMHSHAVKPSDQTLSCEMAVSAEGNHQICNAWPSLHSSLT